MVGRSSGAGNGAPRLRAGNPQRRSEVALVFLADAVLVVHLAFILYVLGGALVMLRWPRLVWADVPTVAVRCHDIKTPPGPDAQDLNDLMVA